MGNPFRAVLKKMWYNQMLKSEKVPGQLVEKFFIEDSIDPQKFRENYAYYFTDRYGSHKPTSSCLQAMDLPLAYPRWFAAAYPDVVKYFSILEESEFTRLFEEVGFTKEDLQNYSNPKAWEIGDQELHHFSLEVLYRLKEGYKEFHPNIKLECQ